MLSDLKKILVLFCVKKCNAIELVCAGEWEGGHIAV